MNLQLKKIKDLLEKSFNDPDKKDMLIGQAIGQLESLIQTTTSSISKNDDVLPIPDIVWKHTEKPSRDNMLDAVQRHKDIHTKLIDDSISQKNTQFKKL